MFKNVSPGQIAGAAFFGVLWWYFAESLGPSIPIGMMMGFIVLSLFRLENRK